MAASQTWIHAPQQTRSEDTTRRILDAAGYLLRDRELGSISVTEIAQRAGVSIGGFYARFPSKDALLHAFDDHLVDTMLQHVARALQPSRFEGAGVREVIEAYISMAFRFFQQNRAIMRQTALRCRVGDEPEFTARVRAFNQNAHGRLNALLAARRAEIKHPDPTAAADFGVMFVSAALREQVLFGERRLNRASARGKTLIRELTRAYCAYLGVTDPNRASE